MLGGKCVRCGATEDLEFDHIDPVTKVFAVCAGLSKAWDVLVDEASKTQLVCKAANARKSADLRAKKLARKPALPNGALGGRLELPTNRLTAGCSAD